MEEILKGIKIVKSSLIPNNVAILCARGVGKTSLVKFLLKEETKKKEVWSVS